MKAIVIHKTRKGFGAEVDFQSTAQADLFIEMLCGVHSGVPDEQMFAMVANS
jgi:hypothetical protein